MSEHRMAETPDPRDGAGSRLHNPLLCDVRCSPGGNVLVWYATAEGERLFCTATDGRGVAGSKEWVPQWLEIRLPHQTDG